MKRTALGLLFAGCLAGAVNGLMGAGGGMVLVPLLGMTGCLKEEEVFPASVCIILPICVISLLLRYQAVPWALTGTYLIGSALGGVGAGIFAKRIPTKWLHRGLGILILWGGIRYLC